MSISSNPKLLKMYQWVKPQWTKQFKVSWFVAYWTWLLKIFQLILGFGVLFLLLPALFQQAAAIGLHWTHLTSLSVFFYLFESRLLFTQFCVSAGQQQHRKSAIALYHIHIFAQSSGGAAVPSQHQNTCFRNSVCGVYLISTWFVSAIAGRNVIAFSGLFYCGLGIFIFLGQCY